MRTKRLTHRGLRLTGSATDTGCGARTVTVQVAVGLTVGTRCRFVQGRGTLGPLVPCGRRSYLTASGTTSWKLTRRVALPTGEYRILVRGTDAARNRERVSRSRKLVARLRA